MSEEKVATSTEETKTDTAPKAEAPKADAAPAPAPKAAEEKKSPAAKAPDPNKGKRTGGRDGKRGPRRGRGKRRPQREESEFDQSIIDLARVTRVTRGGKQMSFRAMVVIGDRKNRVGIGMGKGQDVTNAINKAVNHAKKSMITIPLDAEGTIPHDVKVKFGAAKIMMRPASSGTGIISGGVQRMVLELSGVQNVVSKMYGSSNKINNAKATFEGLKQLQNLEQRKKLRS